MNWLRARPFLVVPLFLCLYGYGTIDAADFYLLAANPLQLNANPARQFLQSSPLPYFLGYPLTAIAGPRIAFAIVMLGGVALSLVALWRMASQRYPDRPRDAVLMVLATPLLIVLTQYLGKSDPFLVAFFLFLVAARSVAVQIVCAALVVTSHLEMGLLVVASAVFLGVVRPVALAGAVLGAAAVLGYHYVLLPAPPQSRATFGVSYFTDAVAIAFATPVAHLVWTFGPFWWCVTRARPLGTRWWAIFAGTLVLATITLDFTRVFVLVGLPLIVATIDKVVGALATAREEPRWLTALPLLTLVQAHLLSRYYYDSRIPEIAGRIFGFDVQ